VQRTSRGSAFGNSPKSFRDNSAQHSGMMTALESEACRQLRRCPIVPNPMGRRCGFEAMSPSRDRSRPVSPCPPAWSPLWTRHVRSWCDLHSPPPGNALPEGSQRVGMDPRDQARWLPAHCPGRTSQSRGPPDSAEAAQAFPRTVCIWSPAMGPSVRPAPCSPIQSFWLHMR
jgi:hypothetical protein